MQLDMSIIFGFWPSRVFSWYPLPHRNWTINLFSQSHFKQHQRFDSLLSKLSSGQL